jgi:hypothetical protein
VDFITALPGFRKKSTYTLVTPLTVKSRTPSPCERLHLPFPIRARYLQIPAMW